MIFSCYFYFLAVNLSYKSFIKLDYKLSKTKLRAALIVLFILCCLFSQSQNADSANATPKKNNDIFKLALNAITIGHSSDTTTPINGLSEAPFLPYYGKIIRHIFINRYTFEKVFSDTSTGINYAGTKLLNLFHTDSREWVIRDNLFIQEGKPVDAYRMADNERYLRSLEFIQDARILIKTIPGDKDSVDVLVITKDLFSLSGEISDLEPSTSKAGVSESNLGGLGQKLAFTALWNKFRDPVFGFQSLYSKTNIAHSFINGSTYYSTINPDLYNSAPDEKAWNIKLDKPLVSQYSRFAGDITFGRNQSFNTYLVPDTNFYKYNYNIFDTWIGYNFGADKTLNNNSKGMREFLSLRYFRNDFIIKPFQIGDEFNFKFNNRQAILAQFVFFRQNYFKTNYIYNFGTTEDVPYGYNIALTAGWYKQLYLGRPYAGIEVYRYIGTRRGDFIEYFLRSGTFLHDGQFQDASILFGTSMFSRLFTLGSVHVRQYLRLSYTRQFNRIGLDALRIDNPFGIRYFSSDSTIGNQRINISTETSFFLKFKLLGFKFAPFVFGDAAVLTPENESFTKSSLYYGIGFGLRARNENFIFGTIELRFVYFPNNVAQNEPFKSIYNNNLLFKYNNNYVNAPDIVQLNQDPNNNIY